MAKFCSECGAALQEGDRFCTSCGSKTFSETAPPAAAPVASAASVAPVAPSAAVPAPAAAPAATRSGLPFARQILTALVWGAFAAGAGYLYERTTAGAISYFIAAAVATFVLLVVLSAIRAVLTAPFRRGRSAATAGAGIGLGAIVLTLIGGTVVAATAFVVGPDIPPGALDPARVTEAITSLIPPPGPAKPFDAAKLVSSRDPKIPKAPAAAPDPDRVRAQTALRQMQAAGVKASSVGIVELENGQKVMVVGVDAFSLGGPDLNAALNALVALGRSNAVDLGGVQAVSVAIHDQEGRALFSMSSSTDEIGAFRSGKATRREFIRGMALRTESKIGVIDAYRQVAGK